MNRPEVTPADRTAFQLGVVPVSVVVQLVEPLTSDTDEVDVGATAWMSGAAVLDSSAPASWMVSVDAEPNPPRAPELSVVLPGRDHEQVRAELVDLVLHLGLRALAETDGEDDRGDADEDAEHRERGAQPVRAHGFGRGAEGVEPVHVVIPARCGPGRRRRAARCGRHGSGSCAAPAARCRARG